jgi:phosphatidylglycerophosphatase GEP4
LKAPVLLHNTPKPGCGSSILEYFQGKLGKPNTLRGHLDEKAHAIRKMEDEDRDLILKKLLKSAEEDPLLGPLVDANGKPTKRRGAQTKQGSEESSVEEDGKRLRDKMVSSEADTSESAKSSDRNEEAIHEEESNAAEEAKEKDDLRLLVIGDRLFTDTLLAHRMSKILPKSSPVAPSVISIHTTGLLDPKDVRVLRWLEKKLSGDKLRAGPVDWSRFVRTVQDDKVIEPTAPSVRDRWRLFRQRIHDSRLQWDPRTWTAFDLSVGMGRGIIWIEKAVWRWTAKGSRWVWAKVKSRSSTALAVEGEVTPAPEKAKLLEKQA